MATSISYQQTEQELQAFKTSFSPADIPYIILRAFGKTDADIRRYKSGKGIVAKFDGLLIKNLVAYRACPSMLMDETLNALKTDATIAKATPRILMVSDGERILAYDPKERETYENPLNKLWIDFQFFYPLCGIERYRGIEENPADVKAAEKMAKLHDEIRAYNDFSSNDDLHELNLFMTRLLFCYFAEDTGIFTDNLFTASITRYTQEDGSDLSSYLATAFDVMDKEDRKDIPTIFTQFPYVNGGLFSKRIRIPQMGRRARKLIIECGELNWKDINPDIFGSMIQAVVSPSLRGTLGMHYTSVPNIMKVIQPLFLDDLYEAYTQAKSNIKKLRQLLIRISKMKFFDPACGSGNFLIIAYKELRKLEIQIWKQIGELSGCFELPFVNIQLTQFYGIEIDDFAHEVASLSLRLAEHQMNRKFTAEFANVSIPALPLGRSGNIVHGNACRVDWNVVCPHTKEEEVFVFGNPPYLGTKLQENNHKEDVDLVMPDIAKRRSLDYISCWFILGGRYIQNSNSSFAFVSTNSITQGEQVSVLWPWLFEKMINISFAYTSFKWQNNAKYNAGVTCVIIGMTAKNEFSKYIYSDNIAKKAKYINAYLVDGPNVFVGNRSKPISNLPQMVYGSKPVDGGNFILTEDEKDELLGLNNRLSVYIKRYMGGDDLLNGKKRYCLWLKNCANDLLSIPEIKNRIDKVRESRTLSTKESTRKWASMPHLFVEDRASSEDYIMLPVVSSEKRKYIPIDYVSNDVIANANAQMIPNADVFIFGILMSEIHNIWVRTICGRLELRYAYSASIVYNNFPFPKISDSKKQEIEEAAEEVLLVREDYPGKTLAELYDPDKMPDDLREAHHRLDLIVESCYQDKPFANDEERLECLFKLYEKMIKE
ncbi:MAG: class I SAM-dependent DNA methyltransferase [Bacteroidaceae bacterium]|nr:class I SAM-dependent DNA methyltransferase [Bacteroidaceae bacterium]